MQCASKLPVTVAPAYKWRNRPLVGAEVAALQVGPRRDEPLRGGRVHPLERRRRLPERDVPLPADRRALRRHRAAGARLPAARRPDVLGRARLGEDHLGRSARASPRCASTTSRPSRTGASGSNASGPPARSSRSRRSSRSTAASSHPGRRARPTRRSSTGCARDAETALHPSCTCAMGRPVVDPDDDARLRRSTGCASSTRACSRTSRTANIYAPVMMVAEKAADLIRGNTPLPPVRRRVLPP